MRRLGGDRADPRLRVPAGWLEIDPGDAVGYVGAPLLQLITPTPWFDADGVRPTMSLSLADRSDEHVVTRLLTEAKESLEELHLVSVDPWTLPGREPVGRRLLLAHTEGERAVTTIVWAAPLDDSDLVVAARVESIHLHRQERALLEAVSGLALPVPIARADDAPVTADLLGVAPSIPWEPTGTSRAVILADPDARILVEASVAATSLKLDATVVRDRATVTATSSPRTATLDPTTADRRDPVASRTTTFHVPAARLAHTIAHWLGLGPARAPASEPVTVPIRLVMNRLVDPSVPPPAGADATAWEQPWFLWTLRSSATDSGLVMVDTGDAGQCAVMETPDEETTRFAPLSSYNVWLTLNWLVSESLGHG